MRRLASAFVLGLVLGSTVVARGDGIEGTTVIGGLKRGVEVKALRAVMPRGSSERAIFAEVRIGGEVGFEVEAR
jgi:hypothetical protein